MRMARVRCAGSLMAAMLVVSACGESEPGRAAPDPAEVERLIALGYLDDTEEVADPSQMRVVQIDRDRAQPGYRLYCSRGRSIAELIDREGNAVNTWTIPDSRHFMSCLLLENGDILFIGILPPADGTDNVDSDRYLARYSWEGRELWRRSIPVHHDVTRRPDGKLAALGLEYRELPAVHATVATRDDLMLLLDGEGQVLERRSIYDALTSGPDAVEIVRLEPRWRWKVNQVDLLHANTIEWMRHAHLFERDPLYAPGNVLVTVRHQNLVAMIEWQSNRLVWAWGQDALIGPHEATVLPSGNLLIFDNGGERGYSRVIELDPRTERITWEYKAPRPADFFTAARGGSQRLPNGNTLITNSNSGYAFEVTPGGETVWKFMSPHLNSDGERRTFRRMAWYPSEAVDAILANR